ncbi:MAG: hypothetical protein IKE21_05635 [Erysipelotrichaceae bacterium]|nr:hypothetical protein [Erysipelotrichaceae bacterium]
MKKYIKTTLIMAVTAFLLYYILLPAINVHDFTFWMCLLVLSAELLVLLTAQTAAGKIHLLRKGKGVVVEKNNDIPLGKTAKVMAVVTIAILICMVLSACIFSPLFMSGRYARRIDVKEVSFSEVPPYSFNQTAIIDRDSSEKLGDKVMGEMTDLISQFAVSKEYSQISWQEGTYRVTPLAYDGVIKYLRNRSEGIPGYIRVNTTTGEARLVRLEKKMRFVPSAYLNESLYRQLRFSHPFTIFGDPTFEIDEEGNPYYVCTTYTYSGINSLRRVTGVIIFDPTDGTSQRYSVEDAPTWIDRVFPETLVLQELNDYGMYQKGFLNSLFAQEGVTQTSEGYNYISKDGDIWLYTGMTSVVSDESNIGFALVDLRTHEAQFIKTSGADEYSVMASAEGEVLNYGYTATFPVLVNINNEPVYLLSLKDSAGLIKMYALVDSRDYQQVYTVKADKDARTAINELIAQFSNGSYIETDLLEKTITIDALKEVILNGNSVFYIRSGSEIYRLTLSEESAAAAVFLKEGDSLHIFYTEEENGNVIQLIG